MRKFLALTIIVAGLGLAACNSNEKSEKEIDSLNQASADSLLNAALSDSATVDSVAIDTLK